MKKDTAEIVKELELCENFKAFYNENCKYMVNSKLPELLEELINIKNLKKSEIIKKSELSEIYAYQIFSGKRHPERTKLICIAIGMSLNIEEAQQLLKTAGYSTLYVKLPFDSIILYGLSKGLSVLEINQLLFENDLETLG